MTPIPTPPNTSSMPSSRPSSVAAPSRLRPWLLRPAATLHRGWGILPQSVAGASRPVRLSWLNGSEADMDGEEENQGSRQTSRPSPFRGRPVPARLTCSGGL